VLLLAAAPLAAAFLAVALSPFCRAGSSPGYLISTIAGGNIMPVTPILGTSASVAPTRGVAVDSAGNAYFASGFLHAVFKLDPSGVLTRVTGAGTPGYSGDGGPAVAAQLNFPLGVAVDSSGNVYVADGNNNRIREISADGRMSTVAGNGAQGYSGDGKPATSASLSYPYAVAVDSGGALYIADYGNNCIRKVSVGGTISTVAGTGVQGSAGAGGPATSAQLNEPTGVAADSSGNLYIADSGNSLIRKVDTTGTISTFASYPWPMGVAVDGPGNVYLIANNSVYKLNSIGGGNRVAGNGTGGYSGDGGPASIAQLSNPLGLAVDASGTLYIADDYNGRLRKVSAGIITTVEGGGTGDGGPGSFGQLNRPGTVARDSQGNVYINDSANYRIRRIAPNGTISTVAGTGVSGYSGDGKAASAAQLNLSTASGLALDASGNLYIADSGNGRVRKVDSSGTITTVAGGGLFKPVDGLLATKAYFYSTTGLAFDASGNLLISDGAVGSICKLDITTGLLSTVAGTGVNGESGDGGLATSAALWGPTSLAMDGKGDLYILEPLAEQVRKIDGATGIINTVAGTGARAYSGDGGPATSAALWDPEGVAADSSGNLYIADSQSEVIRAVSSATGIITTIAGGGSGYYGSGDGGPATSATMDLPCGVFADPSGAIYVADTYDNAVRLLTPIGVLPLLAIQSFHSGSFLQGQNGIYSLTVSNAASAGPTSGTVTVTDTLPSGFTLVSMAGSGWSCAATTCTRSDALAGGASFPAITVTASVSSSTPTQVSNQATVWGGGAPQSGAADLTTIAAAGSAQLSIGTASAAAGQTAHLSVALNTGSTQVSGVQFVLLYDRNTLTVTASAGAAAAGRSVAASNVANGLGIVVSGTSQTAIASGNIVELSIQVAGGAALGSYPITFSAASGADPGAKMLLLGAANGSVTVTTNPIVITGVSNAASGQAVVAPNTWISIYGTSFAVAGFSDTWSNSIVKGSLPSTLDGVKVSVGGNPAYVAYVGAGQINVLTPAVASGNAAIAVTTASGASAPVTVTAQQFSPAFFLWPNSQPVATHANYSWAVKNGTFAGTPTVPAKPGETIILWGTGFGATSPATPAGVEVPSTAVYYTANPVTVTIGGVPAPGVVAALASGYGGLYEVVVTVPSSLGNGDYAVVATVGGVATAATTTLTVQN
jgi:uncharacterized protein (TIGR03437 family)